MKNGMTEEEADREVRDAAAVLKKNELYDKAILDPADPKDHQLWRRDRMNISRSALLKVLEAYDIAPGTCSHIRGQEQIFGSRTTKNKTTNEVTAIGEYVRSNQAIVAYLHVSRILVCYSSQSLLSSDRQGCRCEDDDHHQA